jgi:hypothetical protein
MKKYLPDKAGMPFWFWIPILVAAVVVVVVRVT